jgi:hypothetical protein
MAELPAGALGPDTIACDHPVVIDDHEPRDVRTERAWLAEHYPAHSPYGQAFAYIGKHAFDILDFHMPDGRTVSVCFWLKG